MAKKKWIKDAIKGGQVKHSKGRVRRYLRRVYGNKAFTNRGTIKMAYLNKAIRRVKSGKGRNKQGLLQALYLAKRLKKM